MSDLVVTCPKYFWADWIAEGDPAGTPESGQEWDFGFGTVAKPPIAPGERLYIVCWGRLRGYAPVVRVAGGPGGWAIVRRGGAVAVTVDQEIKGFRGWRRPWWDRAIEVPFDRWKCAGVPPRMVEQIVRAGLPAGNIFRGVA